MIWKDVWGLWIGGDEVNVIKTGTFRNLVDVNRLTPDVNSLILWKIGKIERNDDVNQLITLINRLLLAKKWKIEKTECMEE